jgi:staphylococcal nuclease domain-containing protein 1
MLLMAAAKHSPRAAAPAPACRAKQHLSFLQRAGKVPAVCEYVLSGHRLKLHIPKEGVTIAFNPTGVRCPQRGQPAAAGRPAMEVRLFGCVQPAHPAVAQSASGLPPSLV